MQKRVLGGSGIGVSAMGLGCITLGGPWKRKHRGGAVYDPGEVDRKEIARAVDLALERGVSFFDTAANYGAGRSERMLGELLGARKHKAVIATKFGYRVDEATNTTSFYDDDEVAGDVASHVREDCEASLRRLRTDTIDLFLFHVNRYAPEKAAEVRDVLEELVEEGKIRAYGWSTDDPEGARVFAEGKHCAAIEHHLNLAHDDPEILEVCELFGLASINYSPLAAGLLSGKYRPGHVFPANDRRRAGYGDAANRTLKQLDTVREILMSDGRSVVQGALGWIWARSDRTIPIPGFRTAAQVEENAGALDFGPLGKGQMLEIEAILRPDE